MDWPLLADLPAEDVRQLLSIARRRTFAHGEVVFHRDDPADSLHLILRGRFGVRVATPLGDSVLLDVLGPGQSFGELALLAPGSARSATVSAEMAGTSRATVNRVLQGEVRAKAVALARGRVTVLDPVELRRRCRHGRG